MSTIVRLPRRDLIAITSSLMGVCALAWVYLVLMAADMSEMMAMPGMAAMMQPTWTSGYFMMMFLMWAIMMIGMMLPSVMPTVLIYASIVRKSETQGTLVAPTSAFVSGYILMWIGFSLLATILQWALDMAGLLTPMMVADNNLLGASLLIAAGIYQWLPVKNACLQHCRSPVHFISKYWQSGNFGAMRMGLHHGLYCLGCCWLLMGLLFVGGVMNLLWIAAITVFVLLEKIIPAGDHGGRIAGALMIITGVLLLQ